MLLSFAQFEREVTGSLWRLYPPFSVARGRPAQDADGQSLRIVHGAGRGMWRLMRSWLPGGRQFGRSGFASTTAFGRVVPNSSRSAMNGAPGLWWAGDEWAARRGTRVFRVEHSFACHYEMWKRTISEDFVRSRFDDRAIQLFQRGSVGMGMAWSHIGIVRRGVASGEGVPHSSR